MLCWIGFGLILVEGVDVEAPNRIWAGGDGGCFWSKEKLMTYKQHEYIRADLVDKLIGYVVHDDDCKYNDCEPAMWKDEYCTCGLSDVIKEIRA